MINSTYPCGELDFLYPIEIPKKKKKRISIDLEMMNWGVNARAARDNPKMAGFLAHRKTKKSKNGCVRVSQRGLERLKNKKPWKKEKIIPHFRYKVRMEKKSTKGHIY
ncbi:hypothetical protein RUM44_004977 [Polyplax serrata]|uniref:Uncharacterized protein n=1 Tax=Polyplax serrata TaxID=468196 RepID=A0ABR1AWP7_POLSC